MSPKLEKLRPDFEAYILTERPRSFLDRNDPQLGVTNDYKNPFVQEAWEAWRAAAEQYQPKRVGPTQPDNNMVICPTCTSQFPAIPVNVQKRLQGIEQPVAWRYPIADAKDSNIHWRLLEHRPADKFNPEPLYTGTPPPVPSQSHVHCQGCNHRSEGCPGVQAREALPRYGLAPEADRRARAEGRVEALELLKGENAESFPEKYTRSLAIADTGDYDTVWDEDKLRELFEIAEVPYSMLDRLEMTYWAQQAYIDELKVLLNEQWLPIEAAEGDKDGRYIVAWFDDRPRHFKTVADETPQPWVAAVRWSGSDFELWSMIGVGGLRPKMFRRIMGPDGKPVGHIRPSPADEMVCDRSGDIVQGNAGETIACPGCGKSVTLRMDIHAVQIPRHLKQSGG